MSKNSEAAMWNEIYGNQQEAYDYAGRRMVKAACGDQNSQYQPTIDHIRPYAKGGKNRPSNLILCNWETNEEKKDHFPHWKANGKRFHAERHNGGYIIVRDK